jgi:hypothetical protein
MSAHGETMRRKGDMYPLQSGTAGRRPFGPPPVFDELLPDHMVRFDSASSDPVIGVIPGVAER